MDPILISSTSLASFYYCRKKYYFEYELLLEGKGMSDKMQTGVDIHKGLEQMALGEVRMGASGNDVADVYVQHHPLPTAIIGAEMQVWSELIPGVMLRCTFDLVYRKDDWLVMRDYKSFEKAPTLEVDTDFQGKLYAAVGEHKWNQQAYFEYEAIRQVPPGTLHTKQNIPWQPDECYFNIPVFNSKGERDLAWSEAQDIARDLVRAKEEGRWYRQPHKGWNGCLGCPMKDICVADAAAGGLQPSQLEVMSTHRKPLTLPKE